MTTLPLQGSVATAGAGVNVNLDAFGLAPFSLTGKMLRLTMSVDVPTRIGSFALFVGTNSLANNIKFRFATSTASSRLCKPGEIFTVVLQLAEINTVAGAITLSPVGVPSVTDGFTDVRLQVSDNSTGAINVTLFSLEVIPVAIPGAFVSIVFDDSNDSIVSRAFPKMASVGFAGTSYVIVDAIGTAGRTTLQGTQQLANAGWEIGGHAFTTTDHSNGLTVLTGQQVDDDLAGLHAWLVANFPDSRGDYSFAYPLGKYENTTDGVAIESLVESNGFSSARTILSDVGVSTHTMIESLPPPMPFRMNAMSGISSLTVGQYAPANLIATGGMLDKVANNGGWLILVFHKVVASAPADTTEIAQADFDAIMDAIKARSNLTVAPVRDVLRFTPSDLPGVQNIYRIEGVTGSIVPSIDRVWIKNLSRPFLNRAVTVVDFGDVTRPARGGVFDIVGRTDPVAVTDVRGSRRYSLDILADDLDAADDLDLVLAAGDTVFIQVPNGSIMPRSMYAFIGDTGEARPGRMSKRRVFTLPLTGCAAPGPDVVGATITCAGVLAAFATCQDVIDQVPSCQQLLELIGSPTEVIVE